MSLNTSFSSTGDGKFSIYVLMDYDGWVRYVGITKLTPAQRLKDHIKCANRKSRNTYRDRWIRSLEKSPEIHCIEITDDPSREGYWISFFRSIGARLTNLTDGGDGISGYRHTPESKAKMSAASKGRPKTEETKRRMREAASRRTEEHYQKISKTLKGHQVSESSREKISIGRKARYAAGEPNPMLGRNHSEESKQKNRESQLRKNATKWT